MKNILAIPNTLGNLMININDGESIFHLNKEGQYLPSKHETKTGTPMEKNHWQERLRYAFPETPFIPDEKIIECIPNALSRRKKYLKRIRSLSKKIDSTPTTNQVTTFTLGPLSNYVKPGQKRNKNSASS